MAVLNTRGYSVLVVGDDDLARKLVHVFGVGRGSLVVASDGSEGLRFLTSPSHDRFSLVLVDLKTIDGLPAVRHLRDYEAHQGGSRARVLAVSANARIPNLRETCLEAGFDDVLLVPKPLLPSHAQRLLPRDDVSRLADARPSQHTNMHGRVPCVGACLSGWQ